MPKGKNGRAFWGLALVVAIGIQFVSVDRNNPAVKSDLVAPPGIKGVLTRSCYACHSNETTWSWYAQVAPFSWLFNHEILEARSEMNFSTWRDYRLGERSDYYEELIEQIKDGEMPPWYFSLVDPDSRLSEREIALLTAWATEAKR